MKLGTIGILVAASVVLAGCAQSRQARSVNTSGFLSNYGTLEEGTGNQILLRYQKEGVQWASYNKILLDPVTIWQAPDSPMLDVSAADRQILANNFYVAIYEALSPNYTIVRSPQPNTLRVQVALTDADKSMPFLDTVSTIMPIGLAASQLKGFISGRPSFVGEASMEIKVTDAMSGELLAAGVDSRVGNKSISAATRSWADVNDAMRYWANFFAYRLCQERGAATCEKP